MRCNFSFLRTADERFVVIGSISGFGVPVTSETFTTFQHENDFIERVLFADLEEQTTADLITHAILAASDRLPPNHWLSLTLPEKHLESLGLKVPGGAEPGAGTSRFELAEDLDFQNSLLQAPLPVAIVSGPKHRITFINQAYATALGRKNAASLLNRDAREALPELKGQPCFEALDKVYETGKPHIGVSVRIQIRDEESGALEETYFDFFYYPLRDSRGLVTEVLCVARDVKESVLAREVSDSRESQLFRQWAELETIYQQSPIGMCLLDARDYRILRINGLQAELMGEPARKLIGRRVLDILPNIPVLKNLYERVAAGEAVKNFELTTELPGAPGALRTWLLNFTPVADAFGNVETIASTALELTKRNEFAINMLPMADLPELEDDQAEIEALT